MLDKDNLTSKDLLCFSALPLKREELYPCGAYINSEGRPSDVMFSDVLFDFSKTECKMSHWENIIYCLFRNDENLIALEAATEDIKLFLKLPEDYRVSVYIIPPVPKISREYFGDLNGDGISEKLLDKEDIRRACAWFADLLTRRFTASGFKNIALAGWITDETNSEFRQVISENGYDSISLKACEYLPIFAETVPETSGIHIFRDDEAQPLFSLAVSEEASSRSKYDKLYGLISNKAFSQAVEAAEAEPVIEVCEEPEKEVIEAETIKAEDHQPLAPEILEASQAPETAEAVDGRVYIELQEGEGAGEVPPTKEEKRCCRKLSKKQKFALAGAGIAALLGVAYIMKKSRKKK